jgi:hypothetical protein
LTFIGGHELKPGEGNIHTGATPPWLLNRDGGTSLRKIPSQNARKNPKKPVKLGSDIVRTEGQKIKAGENFLPNFGPVWEWGSRSESRKTFIQEEKELKEKVSEFSM